MDKLEQLDLIAHHCLAAHDACGSDQPVLREILEVVLLELGFQIAALQQKHEADQDNGALRLQAAAN